MRTTGVLLIAVAAVTLILICTKLCSYCDSTDELSQIRSNLKKLREDIGSILKPKKVSSDVLYTYDIDKILDCVSRDMTKQKIPHSELNLDGKTMDEPVIKLYHTNPPLYKILFKCRFLDMLGMFISVIAWTQYSKVHTDKSLKKFSTCVKNLDWSVIEVWQGMQNGNKTIMKCLE